MNTSEEEQKLKDETTQLLRRHPGVPSDFEALFVVKADASAVENARATLQFDKRAAGTAAFVGLLALPLLLPMMICGLGCALHKSSKALKRVVKGADAADVYVYGSGGGFATINNGNVKTWTPPAEGMTLTPELRMFYQSVSGPCGSSVKSQAVLLVRTNQMMSVSESSGCCESPLMADLRSGRCRQVWFVSEKSMLTLPAAVMASQFAGGGAGQEKTAGTVLLESQFGCVGGAGAGIPVAIPVASVDHQQQQQQQQQQQLLAMMMQQQVMVNRTSAPQQKAATKAGIAFRSKAGA